MKVNVRYPTNEGFIKIQTAAAREVHHQHPCISLMSLLDNMNENHKDRSTIIIVRYQ